MVFITIGSAYSTKQKLSVCMFDTSACASYYNHFTNELIRYYEKTFKN